MEEGDINVSPEQQSENGSSNQSEWDTTKDVKFVGDMENRKAGNGWAQLTGYYKKNVDKIGDLISGENEEERQEKINYYKENPDKIHELVREYLEREKVEKDGNDNTEEGKISEAEIVESEQVEQPEQPETTEQPEPEVQPKSDAQPEPEEEPKPEEQPKSEKQPDESVGEDDNAWETDYSKFGKFGQTRFLLDPNDPEPINTEKYLVFSVSDSIKEAVPRDKLIEVYEDKVKNANTAKKYFESTRLAMQISKEFAEDGEMLSKIKEIQETPVYQMYRLSAELETAKKILERRSSDLVRCQMEYDKTTKGGILRRLMNRSARKIAKERLDWTQRDVDNVRNDIDKLNSELKELGLGQTEASKSSPSTSAESIDEETKKADIYPIGPDSLDEEKAA